MLDTVAQRREQRISFELPPALEAREPAEERGAGRDDVRLLVTSARGPIVHGHFRELLRFLKAGDVFVLNRSATIPAALTATRPDGESVQLHLSTWLPAELFVVEARSTTMEMQERLWLPGGALAEFLTPYLNSRRLWVARLYLPTDFLSYVGRYGQPISYRHAARRWPLATYQNVYATEP